MAKPNVAFYWCASCGGCEEAIVDMNELILNVVASVNITLWPVALDFKYNDIKKYADGDITASFINGSVRTSEQEHICKLLRQKSQFVISFGACSHLGGIPGLANFYDKDSIFERAYKDTESTENPANKVPLTQSVSEGKNLKLPEFYNRVYSLNQIIDVDYYIPGCPPVPDVIKNALVALLKGELPPKGAVLTENKSLCWDCSRKDTRPDKVMIKEFKRPYEVLDDGKCFLEQGVICLGPATRTGCSASCIGANMPCRGCFGPTDNVMESGSKALSAISSIIETDNPEGIENAIKRIADPSGLFYRYSLPVSILQDTKKEN